jgi:integrase
MSDLANAVVQYLAQRRSLGFKLRHAGRELPRFAAFVEEEGASFVTTRLALRWALEDPESSAVTRSDRLAMARRFAAWRSAADPRTEIPPRGLLPRRYQRPAPYIYSDNEVERIVTNARALPSPRGLRGQTCSTLFGLLAVTGMRIGEAVALNNEDVNLDTGVLTIRSGKGGKARLVPVHSSSKQVLAAYAQAVRAVLSTLETDAFFVSERGDRVSAWSADDNFIRVLRAIGLRSAGTGRRWGRGPRLHDLRHYFAVSSLIRWYRAGVDVDRELPKLATYLGHAHVDELYWYLQAVPELLQAVTDRARLETMGGAP